MNYFNNRKSNFTISQKLNEKETLIHNTSSNTLIIVENEVYERFEKCNWSISEQERWIEGGFLIEDELDEREDLLNRFISARNYSDLSLTICPTLGCNLRCGYCYEDSQSKIEFMSDSVADEIVSYVEKNRFENLVLTWYGGEPLLALSRILELQDRLKSKTNKIISSMITNGVLLTKKTFDDLIVSGVGRFQITIDGSKFFHDLRRITPSGGGTFDVITQNLRDINCDPKYLSIRVNIDKENKESFISLLEYFDEDPILRKYLSIIYPAPVTAWSILPNNWTEKCLGNKEYAEYYFDLSDLVYDRYNINIVKIPETKNMYCGATVKNHFVIGPKGELYKCYITVGDTSTIVGYLNGENKDVLNKEEMRFWDQWNPFNNDKCYNCQFLPLCMGGCPGLTHIAKKNHEDQCFQMKSYYIDTVSRAIRGDLNEINASE